MSGKGMGALLRNLRERARLTQEQLADQAGLSVRTVRRLEGDAIRRPRVRTILLLADALRLGQPEQEVLLDAALGPVPPTAPLPATAPAQPTTASAKEEVGPRLLDTVNRLDALMPAPAGEPDDDPPTD